jgi:hypothetical protein
MKHTTISQYSRIVASRLYYNPQTKPNRTIGIESIQFDDRYLTKVTKLDKTVDVPQIDATHSRCCAFEVHTNHYITEMNKAIWRNYKHE